MGENKWPPSTEVLKDLYLTQGKTTKALGEIFRVKPKMVRDYLSKNGIRRNENRGSWFPDIEEFKELYLVQNKTMEELAEYYHTTKSAVNHFICRRGLLKPIELRIQNTQKALETKYGTTNVREIPGVEEKIRATNKEKYGTEYTLANPEVKKKIAQTIREKYHCDFISQSEEIQNKKRQNCIEKHGVSSTAQLPEVRAKIQKTCEERYGTPYASQNPVVMEKIRNTTRERYGVDFYSELLMPEKTRNILNSAESFEEYLKSTGFNTTPRISQDLGCSIYTIDLRLSKFGLWKYIDSSLSCSENELKDIISSWGVVTQKTRKVIAPYEIDIYCPDYKIGIEFNGDYWHSSSRLGQDYHSKKSLQGIGQGVAIFHIYEREWKTNREDILARLHSLFFGESPIIFQSGQEYYISLDEGEIFWVFSQGVKFSIEERIKGEELVVEKAKNSETVVKAGQIKIKIL